MGQLSFWSADARPRALSDLEGLLCGPGRAELFGRGSAARLTILLGPPPAPQEDAGEEDGEEDSDDVADDETGDGPSSDADADGQDREDAEAAPGVDPDDLAFLDLDPDEIATRFMRLPGRGARGQNDGGPGVSLPRECGDPGVTRQRSRIARTPVREPEEDPVAAWRAQAVCCALRARGVPAEIGRAEDGRAQVRTAFRSDLADLARAWTCAGGMKTVPAGFELDGPRLRLWVLAAGASVGRAYTLGLDPAAGTLHDRLLTASRHLGLSPTLGSDADVPVLRIVGARRQGRLGELVGRSPRGTAAGVWPV